jgi:UDP-2,3-diacylglucosamine pyrophosphatase LpxH
VHPFRFEITFFLFVLSCSSAGGPSGLHQEGVDSKTDRALKAADSTIPKTVRIAVLGDRTGHPDDEVFTEILREIHRLSPDAIASVGDLIEGYQPDEKSDEVDAEWDHVAEMTTRYLGKLPTYITAGNHDVWGDKSRAIFERRFNPINATFDLGYAAFIVFDTSRAEREIDIAEADLNWLVRALFQYRDKKARIVLTHRPLFAEQEGGEYGAKLHDVFIGGNATLVICGHWHHSMSDDRDDIQYRMLGPSGASPNRDNHRESGNLAQFGWLVIDENGAQFSIIKADGVLPSDTFPYEMNQLEWRIENRAVMPVDFDIDPVHPASRGSFDVSFSNITDDKLVTALSLPQTNWQVAPGRRDIQLEAGKERVMRFSFIRKNNSSLFPGPKITASFPFFGTTYLLTKYLAPTLRVRVKKASNPPALDGDLSDAAWKGASKLGPFMEIRGLDMPFRTDARAVVLHNTLYLGFQMLDPDMEGAVRTNGEFLENSDHLLILVDDDLGTPERRRIVVTPFGRVSTQWIQSESSTGEFQVTASVSKSDEGWTVEVAVPLGVLPKVKGRRTIGFNFARGRVRGDKSSKAYWQPLLEHEEESLGKLVL